VLTGVERGDGGGDQGVRAVLIARAAERLECLVVGGGLAGLACAHRLARAGRSVAVVEAQAALGGRAQTDWVDGRPVDRGFQALFLAYPETGRFLSEIGLPRRDLRPFRRGAMIHDGERWTSFDPGPRGLLASPLLSWLEAARLARMAAGAAARRPEALLREDEAAAPTTETFLRERGFSDRAIDGLFRPLFGTIFLDRSLATDAGYFRFLLAMLARGPAALPSDGLGMIADWAGAAIRQAGGTIETGVRAEGLEADPAGRRAAGVRLADGRRLEARFVVLAVDAPAARRLLEPVDPATAGRVPILAAAAATAAFALSRPLYRGRTILLNGAPERADGAPRVDLLCQTTNVVRPGAPDGPHVVLATSVRTDRPPLDHDAFLAAVGFQVGRWSPGFPWAEAARPLGVTEHPFAQFRPVPGVREHLPGPRTALDNLVLAGDLTHHPSIEGAVASGRQAAAIVAALAG
jgi:phytoene dehydrogenase-like protein